MLNFLEQIVSFCEVFTKKGNISKVDLVKTDFYHYAWFNFYSSQITDRIKSKQDCSSGHITYKEEGFLSENRVPGIPIHEEVSWVDPWSEFSKQRDSLSSF